MKPTPDGGTASQAAPAAEDPRVIRALEEYLAAFEAGRRPDRREFLAGYPEVAEALAECLDGLEFVQAAAPRLSLEAEARPAGAVLPGDLLPATVLGDFRILREVGRGGMGVVYQAEQVSLGRPVALKVLPLAAALDARQLQRFKNEAQAAAQLHHTNIVPVYAVGCERGVHYYAMQFIEGQSLAAVVRDLRRQAGLGGAEAAAGPGASLADELASGRWAPAARPPAGQRAGREDEADSQQTTGYAGPPQPRGPADETPAAAPAALPTDRPVRGPAFFRTVARLGVQAAEALEYAHQMGVVHRDVKPANLLLDARGNLWVTDFGLAWLGGDAGLTLTGDLVGTVRYMSPEQTLARRVPADHRMDVYSLGATLYELLTLEPAVRGGNRAELLRQVVFEDPRPPRRLNKAVPAELETIVLKALEKSPAQRYATAQELADDLQRYLNDEPIRARRPTLVQRARKWARRHRSVVSVALLAVAILLLAGGAAFAVSYAGVQLALQRETEAKNELRDALDRERQVSYYHRIALAHREWLANNVGGADHLLDECRRGLRHWEWHYLKRLCHLDLLTFRGRRGSGRGVAYSPDGRRLASASLDGSLKVWDARTGLEVVAVDTRQDMVSGVAYSPDGRRLATGSWDKTVKVWDVATGREVLTLRGTDKVFTVAFSPDGQYLASAGHGGAVEVWKATTGEKLRTLRGHTNIVQSVAFRPNSRQLASAGGDIVKVWDVTTGQDLLTLRGHRWLVLGVAYSPDGGRLATAGLDKMVKLWDATTGAELRTLRGHADRVRGVAFSPDSQRLASAGDDQTLKVWDATTGAELRTLRGHADRVTGVAFSPDGRRLASAGDDVTVRVWDATADQEALTFRECRGRIWGVAFDPDGRCLTAGNAGPRLKVWDAKAGQELFTVVAGGFFGNEIAFSSDGRHFAWSCPDRTVQVWDAAAGRVVQAFGPVGGRFVTDLALSPDSRYLAAAGMNQTVCVWDLTAGRAAFTLSVNDEECHCKVAFSPDGRHLAWSSFGGTVRVCDLATAQEVRAFPGRADEVSCLAFSPDGRRLAWSGLHRTVTVAEVATGQELLTLRGHNHGVSSIAFSPDGQRLASGSYDQTVRVWDLRTGQEVLTLRGHTEVVHSVAFSPDGRSLASAGWDWAVRVWDATPPGERATGTVAMAEETAR
jgi:WD40 repeat protein/serine/threonine protein kinase